MLQLRGENNVLIAVFTIFLVVVTLLIFLFRYPLLRNFFLLKPLALLCYHLESASCGVADWRTYPRYRTALHCVITDTRFPPFSTLRKAAAP